jgi:hypothetical protein
MASTDWLTLLLFRLSTKRNIHGITVSTLLSETEKSFQKVEAALDLIKELSPARHRRILKYVPRILVFGELATWGTWHQKLRLCQIDYRYLASEETSIPSVGCTLLHEATHAYLHDRNIPYDEPVRWRVEQICLKTERHLARRLPVQDVALLASLEASLACEPSSYSKAARIAAKIQALKDEGTPRWIVSLLERRAYRRLRKAEQNKQLTAPHTPHPKNPGTPPAVRENPRGAG